MLQAQCDDAMFLDNTICTKYASQTAPSKPRYRPRKLPADAFQEEINRLELAGPSGGQTQEVAPSNQPGTSESALDYASMEQEVAVFMRNRRRK